MDARDVMEWTDVWPGRVVMAAAELGVFRPLQEHATAAQVAAACGTDAPATERLLDALTGLGLLTKADDRYGIAPGLEAALSDGEGSILPGVLLRARLWHRWSDLPEVVRSGGPVPIELPGDPESRQHDFSQAMAVMGREEAQRTAALLDLDGARRLLDIGGAPGTYARAFRERHPDLDVTILDRPEAEAVTREHTPDVRFVGGDALEIEDGAVLGGNAAGRYDVVFTSNVIHAMSPEQTERLLARCAAWTRPGGRIVVKEFFVDDTRTRPAWAAVFGLNMLIATEGGTVYTWREVETLLEQAGAQPTDRIHFHDDRNSMVVGTVAGERA